ncbi:Uncharacterised protein [Vibrio cholerae]|nr:Uncharacterised protein [Vibrio cholerae]
MALLRNAVSALVTGGNHCTSVAGAINSRNC